MERRRTARLPFFASAELIIHADLIQSTSVSELSRGGCCLESNTSLPRGTLVIVKIFASGEVFEATATVLYSRATLGMGLCFGAVKPESKGVLQKRQALDKYYAPPPSIREEDS
jgi:PilZ domain